MTFQQIVSDICGRMNLVSADAIARVGQSVNRHYRRVTATIGLEPLRYITRTGTTAINSDKVTFTGIEKIDRVFERAPDGTVLVLQPVMLAQLREGRELQGSRYGYAIWQQTATDITILLPGLALAITDLYADGWTTLADLAGTDEPAIPSSFHDILTFSVVAEELLRKEKTELSDRFMAQADNLLKELRFHQADAPAIDFRQGDHIIGNTGGGGTGGAGSSVITGDIVFDRDPGPPFTVTAGSGKVDNLDADELDGQHGPFYLDRANHTGPLPVAALPAHHTSHEPGGADALVALDAGILTQGTIPPARIADNSITDAKLADLPAANLLGRGSAAGTGDPQPITLGTGLAMTGTVLATSGTAIAVPAGTDTQVQFNNAGAMAGNPGLTYNGVTDALSVGESVGIGGAAAAQSGSLRLLNGGQIRARNAANTADVALVTLANDDAVVLNPNASPLPVRIAGGATIDGVARVLTDLYEKGRVTPMGHWIDVPFSAANFSTPTPGCTWVVAGQSNYSYTLIGKTVLLTVGVASTTITGTPVRLTVLLPAGLTPARSSTFPVSYFVGAGVPGNGIVNLSPGVNSLDVLRDFGGTVFPAGTNTFIWISLAYSIP